MGKKDTKHYKYEDLEKLKNQMFIVVVGKSSRKKYIYFRNQNSSETTLPIYPITVSKNVNDLNVFIGKHPKTNLYCIFDEQTGLGCGKSFKHLRDAISFIDNRLEEPFIDWIHKLNDARSSNKYHYLCLLLKRLIQDYEKEIKTKKEEPVRVL